MSTAASHGRTHVSPWLALLVALLATVPLLAVSQDALAQESAADAGDGGFAICEGLGRGAEVDIVVLMDVSLSLVRGGSDGRGSDPEGVRFEAVDRLIDGLALTADGSQPARNIAVVTFGGESDVVVPFGEALSGANAAELQRATRGRADPNRLPSEVTSFTNYTVAVTAAEEMFRTRPAENCRVLVWFTDGVHDPNNIPTVAADGPEATELLGAFCGDDGLVMRLRDQDVAPFVLFLEPTVSPAFTERLGASVAVMKAITGDPAPRFGRLGDIDTPPCDVPATEKVGEILPASEADRLVGLLGDLANAIDGGRPITPEACPYDVADVDSYRLPDAHLVEWVSLASYDIGRTVTLRDLRVVDAQGATVEGALRVLTGDDTGSLRVAIDPAARDTLGPGWRIELDEATDLCLRLNLLEITFEVSARPSVRPLEPADLPARLYEGRLALADRNGAPVPLESGVVIPPGVSGLLEVEDGAPFLAGGRLAVDIVVVGAPSIDCTAVQVPDPATRTLTLGRVSVPDGPIVSTVCALGLDGVDGEVTIDAAPTIAALEASCPSGSTWELVAVEGGSLRPVGPSLVVASGSPVTGVLLRTGAAVPNADIDCTDAGIAPLAVTWQGATTEVPVRFDEVLGARPNTVATLIATLTATVVAALLSLVLLKLLNARWLGAPPAGQLQGYETTAELVVRGDGQVSVAFPGGGFSFDQDGWRTVEASGPGSLRIGGVVLRRKLPSIFAPWAEPVLVVENGATDGRPSVVTPHGALDDVMPVAFRDAVVLVAKAPRVPTPELPVPVGVTVVLPRSGSGSGRTNVDRLIREAIPGLSRRLRARLDEVQASATQSAGGNGPSGPTGPGGPNGPAGPGGPGGGAPKPPWPPKAPSGPAPSGPKPAGPGSSSVPPTPGTFAGPSSSTAPRPPTGPPRPPTPPS